MAKPRRSVITSSNGEGARGDKLRAKADTPIRLLKDIEAGRIDPQDLTVSQRRACLVGMANGKRTSPQLATVFCCSAKVIRDDLAWLRRELGREVREWTLDEVVGDLYLAQEKAVAGAMKAGDVGLMWTIKKDWAKLLVDLGVVHKADNESSFRATIELVGRRYDHATEAVTQLLDPLLTGMVQAKGVSGLPGLPMQDRDPRGPEGFDKWPLLEPEVEPQDPEQS